MEIITYDYETHKDRKIIVYGTGSMGYITFRCLQELNVSVYHYANRKASYHALFGNVISVEEMLEIYKNEDVIILFAVMNIARSETEYLYQRGIDKIYSVRKLWKTVDLCDMDWSEEDRKTIDNADKLFFTEDTIADPKRLYLYSLDAVVTERCSLKCKDCSNLMQYYQHPKDMKIDEIKKMIDTLLRKDCRIYDLRILGGEPLMNKDFVKIVDWYKNEEKIERISIFSNATIFPDDATLEHLKSDKFFVRLSDYGKYSYKLEEWVQWCTENNIRHEVVKIEKWHDCGRLERHNYCEQELISIYSGCECRNLPTVKGGYLYNCPYSANAADLGAMTLNEMNQDRLLLTDSIDADEIDRFLYERKYLEACRYCKGRNSKWAEIIPYIQTKSPLAYRRLLDTQPKDIGVSDGNSTIETERGELVSVVIPTYNMEKYVVRCLTSVLRSSYQNLDIIVVDDGSEDTTVKLCKRIAERDSLSRVRIIENEHAGVVKTRNTGIMAARGKYITFVDADDYIAYERLAVMVEAIDGCDMVCAGYTDLLDDILVSDELMDRGQSKIYLHPCSIPEGIYAGEKLWSFIKRSLWSFGHSDILGTTLWRFIFRTDMMKNICGQVDQSIWYGEDLVLSQIYSSYCNKIGVVNNSGYYRYCRDVHNRYSFEGIMANMEKIYHCLQKAFINHPKTDYFRPLIQEEYIELCVIGLGLQELSMGLRNIYYPYYGRLKGKKVILYGAGNVGRAYFRHMKNDGECLLVAWVDKNAEIIRELDFLPVESVDSIYSKEYDYIIIAVFDEVIYNAIYKELVGAGIKEETIIWNPTRYEW